MGHTKEDWGFLDSRASLVEARLRRPGTAKPRTAPKRVRARALLAQRARRRAKMTARRCAKHANRWAAISVGRLRGTYLLNPASAIGLARRSHVSRTGTLCSCQTSTTEQKRGERRTRNVEDSGRALRFTQRGSNVGNSESAHGGQVRQTTPREDTSAIREAGGKGYSTRRGNGIARVSNEDRVGRVVTPKGRIAKKGAEAAMRRSRAEKGGESKPGVSRFAKERGGSPRRSRRPAAGS